MRCAAGPRKAVPPRWCECWSGMGSALSRPGNCWPGPADGQRAGAVSEGTMDTVALPLLSSAAEVPGTAKGHVTEPDALAAGLACSGGAQLLGHPLPVPAAAALGTSLANGEPCGL